MKKQAPLRHPIDIRHDERIAALIGERGHAGYGLYWLLIETLHREPDMHIPYTELRIRRLAASLGLPAADLSAFLHDLLYVYDLLALDDHCCIVSAITYRRPRRPRPLPAATTPTTTETPTKAEPAPDDTPVTPPAETSDHNPNLATPKLKTPSISPAQTIRSSSFSTPPLANDHILKYLISDFRRFSSAHFHLVDPTAPPEQHNTAATPPEEQYSSTVTAATTAALQQQNQVLFNHNAATSPTLKGRKNWRSSRRVRQNTSKKPQFVTIV